MARKFLTNLDMAGNQLLNATLEKLATAPNTGNFEGRMYYNTSDDLIYVYNGSSWTPVGSVTAITGTANEVEVSASTGAVQIGLPSSINVNAATATKLETARTISLGGDLSGSATFDGSANITITASVDSNAGVDSIGNTDGNIVLSASVGSVNVDLASTISSDTTGNAATADALSTARTIALGGDLSGSASFDGSASITITADIQPDSVALGTDTTGDYVASVSASDGISASGTGEGASVSLTNTDKGSSQNIFKTISGDTGSVTAASNSASVTIAGGTGITTSASSGTVTIDNDGVLSVSGTGNQISASTVSGAVTLSLPSAVTFPGTVTLNADPGQPLEAATKQYVDNAVAGLDWHQAVNLLWNDTNPPLSGSTGTLLIDGHSALTSADNGYRILITSASTTSGIYTYNDNGSTWTVTRAADADAYGELVGAAVFVMEGDVYGSTAWIQTNHYLTDFSGQTWTQFSGSGTYTAGNGLQIAGTQFSIDTDVTVDVSTAQTLSNKTLTSPTVSGLYLSDNNIVIEGTNDVHETTLNFTDPTQDNTITFKDASGTVAFTSDIPSNTDGLTEGSTNLYFTSERAEDAVGAILTDTATVDLTYTDNGASAGTITADVILKATNSYLSSASGLAVDISALETKLVTDAFTKKASASVGNGVNTSFALSHNFNTRDVVVNVYDNATYESVEVDVVRTDVDTVTVSFASAPSSNAYRVVVIG